MCKKSNKVSAHTYSGILCTPLSNRCHTWVHKKIRAPAAATPFRIQRLGGCARIAPWATLRDSPLAFLLRISNKHNNIHTLLSLFVYHIFTFWFARTKFLRALAGVYKVSTNLIFSPPPQYIVAQGTHLGLKVGTKKL